MIKQLKNYGNTIIQIYENIQHFLSYKQQETNTNQKKNLTIFDLIQIINDKMDEYDHKIVSLQKKNAEYHLKYKIHECDVSMSELLEKSEIYPKIRNLFETGEYTEGVELLKNANYQKSSKVSYEEMLNWMAISNRMKDIKLDDMETKTLYNKENVQDCNREKSRDFKEKKKNNHMIISNQITSLMQENQNLKKKLENERNLKDNTEEKITENYNKIVHQQIDNMKWSYIEQIKEFEKKVFQLNLEKEELLLIIQELDRLSKKQKEIISKNEEKFAHLKKYSLYNFKC